MQPLWVEQPPREPPPTPRHEDGAGVGVGAAVAISLGAEAQRDLREQLVFGQLHCQQLFCNVLLVLLTLFVLPFYFFKLIYIDLQCCVGFRYTAELFSYTNIYFQSFFFRLFSLIGYYRILRIVPCAIN